MKCSDIKRLLSEYVDETLDEITRSNVEQHLQSCESCRNDYATLKSVVHETGALPKINAPDDFLENIHARMESRFNLKRIARALFMPFKLKIPLELLTATAAGVLIFLFVNIQQQEKSMTDLHDVQETETLKESPSSEDMLDAGKTSRGPSEDKQMYHEEAPKAPLVQKNPPTKERSGLTASQRSKKQSLVMGKAAPAPAEQQRKSDALEMIEKNEFEKPIELALLIEPAPADTLDTALANRDKPDQAFKDMASEPVNEKKTPGDESTVQALKAPVASGRAEDETIGEKESKERMLLESSQTGDVSQSTAERIESIVKESSGKIVSVKVDEGTHRPESILAEIPSSKFKSFYSQLSRIGQVKQPLPVIDETKNERLRINIQLITTH